MMAPSPPRSSESAATLTAGDDRHHWSVAVLTRLAAAVFVTDADARILFCNAAAEGLARQCEGTCPHAGASRGAPGARTCPRLAGILRTATAMALGGVASGHRTVLVAPRPAGAPLELVSVCLDGAPGQGRAAVAIFVCERSSSSSLSDRELQTLYGLTPAEARVARLLASGRSVAAIARELRVSPNTVRTQLKATFAKTDTCQQSELAALIARSVAAVVC